MSSLRWRDMETFRTTREKGEEPQGDSRPRRKNLRSFKGHVWVHYVAGHAAVKRGPRQRIKARSNSTAEEGRVPGKRSQGLTSSNSYFPRTHLLRTSLAWWRMECGPPNHSGSSKPSHQAPKASDLHPQSKVLPWHHGIPSAQTPQNFCGQQLSGPRLLPLWLWLFYNHRKPLTHGLFLPQRRKNWEEKYKPNPGRGKEGTWPSSIRKKARAPRGGALGRGGKVWKRRFSLESRRSLRWAMESKKIKPVTPKEHQLWIYIGRTDAEAETLGLWPPDTKNQLIGRDPDTGTD